jgi:hypothetical protein
MPTANIRYNKNSAVITAYAKVTTTVTITTASTTKTGTAFSAAGYGSGVFITRVVANASGAAKCYLQGSVDGTTYANIATLHSDLTTTANNKYKFVEGLSDYIRIGVTSATTTTHARIGVKCLLKVI